MKRSFGLLLLLAGCRAEDTPRSTPLLEARGSNPTSSATVSTIGQLETADVRDGPTRNLLVERRTVTLVPFVIDPPQGPARSQCGVLIDGQRLRTLGAGDLDAYVCTGLVDARPLPASATGARVGLLYDANSREGIYRTVAVLVRDGAGRWIVDASATTIFDNLAERSWVAFAQALREVDS